MEEGEVSAFLPLIVITGLFIYFVVIRPRKKRERKKYMAQKAKQEVFENWDTIENSATIPMKSTIPTQCPHCKSPNPKKLQECEWCGNNIC